MIPDKFDGFLICKMYPIAGLNYQVLFYEGRFESRQTITLVTVILSHCLTRNVSLYKARIAPLM